MEIEALKKICSGTCVARRLGGRAMNKDVIGAKTVRTKGQYTMQRFLYIRGGSVRFELNDKVLVCKRGDILYLPPDITYVCYWDPDNEENASVYIQFDLYVNDEKIALSDDMFVILNDEDGRYMQQFLLFAKTYNEGRFGYNIRCQSIVLDLVYSFITEHVKDEDRQKNSTVYKGIVYIQNNYMGEIDVNKLANMCSMCPTTFRSHFHRIMGMSPIQYKNYLTMKKAAELLRSGLYDTSEVAYEVGMNDVCYFNRTFKKLYGIPPGQYRVEHINKNRTV